MRVLEALRILEDAVSGSSERNVNTSEVKEALDLLEPHILPPSLIPRFRYEVLGPQPHKLAGREGQQRVLQATFPGIRDSLRILLRRKMNRLARELIQTHDPNVREELRRLSKEYGELNSRTLTKI